MSEDRVAESAPSGWQFEVGEVSNGWWAAEGRDDVGHSVSRHGSDPDEVLREAWLAARWVVESTRASNRSADDVK